MSNNDIEILLSSDSDYEEITAEIFIQGRFVALLDKDRGSNNLQIDIPFSSSLDENLILRQIDLNLFLEAINRAKKKLLEEK